MKTLKYLAVIALSLLMALSSIRCSDDKSNENPTVDKTALQSELTTANELLATAVEGDEPGQYPKSAIDAFKEAIRKAVAVRERENSTQQEVDQAVTDLKAAENVFKLSVVGDADVDKAMLKTALDEANAKIGAAIEGTKPGEYPKAAMDAFRAAIVLAQGVYDAATPSQAAVDQAINDLKVAQKTFGESVVEQPQIDKIALKTALDEANAKIGAAIEGTKPGEYPKAAMDAFRAAIVSAQGVYDAATPSQAAVDQAVTDLKLAQTVFVEAVISDDADSSLSLYLHFDGDAIDASTYQHMVTFKPGETGQPVPSLTTDRMGAPNHAYKFQGGFMSIPNHASLNGSTMSVMFWMRVPVLSATDTSPLSFNWWDCYMAKIIGGAQNEIAFVAGGASVQSGVMLDINRWYHVAITRSTTELTIYVDGELKNTQATTGGMNRVELEPLRIGILSENPGYYYPFIGDLDEIRIYNEPLTAEKVIAIYDEERP